MPDALVRRWEPSRLTPEAATMATRLSRRRPPAGAAGWSAWIVVPPEEIEAAEAHALVLDGAPATLEMPRALLQQVLAALDPAAPDATGEARRMLLELALEDVAAALAPVLPVTLSEKDGALYDETTLLVGLECHAGTGQWTGRLYLSTQAATALAAALERLAPAPLLLPAPPVALRVRVGMCELPLRELRDVRPGDVLLGEGLDQAAGYGAVLLVAEERWAWQGRRNAGEVAVLSPRAPLTALGSRGWIMVDETPQPLSEAELNDLPMRLVFEAGRMEVSLGELGQIGPGHVFALPGVAGLVDILANGQRIGQGELVQVGEGAGVRVLRLHRTP